MRVRYENHQDKLDPMHGCVLADGASLAALLESRRKKPPFIARIAGDNGFELAIGIGDGVGWAQYSRSDGSPPYLVAISKTRPVKSGSIEFLTADTPTPVPARKILSFGELKEIAIHFLQTGERSPQLDWGGVEITEEDRRGRMRPTQQQHALRLLLLWSKHRYFSAKLNVQAIEASAAAPNPEPLEVRYWNHHDDLDLTNGRVISETRELNELFQKQRNKAPFVAELSANNGLQLLFGIGSGVGFAQCRRIDGDLPYFMAVPPQRRVGGGNTRFLVSNVPMPIPARYVLNFDEVSQIASHFLKTGARSAAFVWKRT
jgi:hypothetical protein